MWFFLGLKMNFLNDGHFGLENIVHERWEVFET